MIKNLSTSLLVGLSIVGSVSAYGQCTPVSEFSENFDALFCCEMGVVPPCWKSITTSSGGNQIISNTAPASSPRNVYQIGYNNVSIVIMPPLTNINAGTHHFKFKARINQFSAPGRLDFGYITEVGDASTFVTLQSITIENGTYDSTSERTFDVPTTVPANARLAIRNPGISFSGHYWDDAVWEPKSALSTDEIGKKESLKVYPNPFNNTLNISDIKDVKSISINDAAGRVIKTIEKPTAILELNDLEKGVYFVNLHFKNGTVKSFKSVKN